MGYTHYWTETKKPEAIPFHAVGIIWEIVQEAYQNGIVQRDFNDPRPPVVTPKEVRFNGISSDGHETFYYSVAANYKNDKGEYFSFCKTARKPYDEVVMKVLIVLKWSLDDTLELRSDGSFNDEWKKVRQEVGERYNIRIHIKSDLEKS